MHCGGAAVASSLDVAYVTRLFLAELAADGDARAAEILGLHSPGAAQVPGCEPCRVVVAVCTAKRPTMLRHCLDSIAAQIVGPQIEVALVVVDNEAEPNNRA